MIQTNTIDGGEQSGMSNNAAYVAGFFDACGTISISIQENELHKLGHQIQARVGIRKAQVEKYAPAAGRVMEYADSQKVKYTMNEYSDGIEFEIVIVDSIERFLEPLLDHLVATYEEAVVILEVALPLLRDGAQSDKQKFYELVGVADDLRERPGSVKYTQEYFEDEWGL